MLNLTVVAALALAANPEVFTLQVGESPEVALSAIHGTIDVRREGNGPVRITAELPPRGGHRHDWVVEVRSDKDQVHAKVCCGKCESNQDAFKDCSDGPVKLSAVLPERADLKVSCVSAEMKVQGGSGETELATVSGPVQVTGTRGEVSVSAVSSHVSITPARTRHTQVNTVSGDVVLRLPASTDAQLHFSTLSGEGPRRTRLGAGEGAEIQVSTLSGDLKLRESGER
ncbi:MAG: DUF4097 domain-containing protein [Myxococcota bacterium]|nr:DUF4097 domain-containing protein [Myxococcota bacterium]